MINDLLLHGTLTFVSCVVYSFLNIDRYTEEQKIINKQGKRNTLLNELVITLYCLVLPLLLLSNVAVFLIRVLKL